MLFVAILLLALVALLISIHYYRVHAAGEGSTEGAFVAIIISTAVASITFLIIVVITATAYTNIIHNNAAIHQTQRSQIVLERRANDVGDTLEEYLAERYPTYEQETLEKIVGQGPQFILLQFPELKTADTFVEYTRVYKQLKDDVYAQAVARNHLLAANERITENELIYITELLP